jgi:nitrogen fixation NifU-like protein
MTKLCFALEHGGFNAPGSDPAVSVCIRVIRDKPSVLDVEAGRLVAMMYSDMVLEHYRHPRNRGRLADADATAEAANPLCGDVIRFEITVKGSTIAAARFSGDACAISTAAASLLTELVSRKPLDQAADFTDEMMIASLEADIPPARVRCALLPLEALRQCLTRWERTDPGDSSGPSVEAVPSPSPTDVQERLWPESA